MRYVFSRRVTLSVVWIAKLFTGLPGVSIGQAVMNIRRVLLVDDDRNIRRIAEITLTQVGGFEVFTAGSSAEALRLANEVLPDVILLDVIMPDLDGVGTFKLLREQPQTAAIPVILLTAQVTKGEYNDYENLGLAGIIVKPFDPMLLPEQMLQILQSADGQGTNTA